MGVDLFPRLPTYKVQSLSSVACDDHRWRSRFRGCFLYTFREGTALLLLLLLAFAFEKGSIIMGLLGSEGRMELGTFLSI